MQPTTRAGVIGTGHFATAVVTQSESMDGLTVAAVAELNLEAARRAFRLAGVAEDAIAFCESRAEALAALDRGQRVIVEDALLLMELPVDVIDVGHGSQPGCGSTDGPGPVHRRCRSLAPHPSGQRPSADRRCPRGRAAPHQCGGTTQRLRPLEIMGRTGDAIGYWIGDGDTAWATLPNIQYPISFPPPHERDTTQ